MYIPNKTKDGRPKTVRVPLNNTAKAILEKYKECEDDRLLTREEVKRLYNVCDAAFRHQNNCTIYLDNASVRWWFRYRVEHAIPPPTIIDKYHNNVLIIHNVMKYWIEHRG